MGVDTITGAGGADTVQGAAGADVAAATSTPAKKSVLQRVEAFLHEECEGIEHDVEAMIAALKAHL
ncbi:MAG: hypothetical protein ACLGP3_10445 [Acidobacteriota bacterium]